MLRRRKSHMVFFRIHEDDYEKLVALCESQHADSISELVRAAVLRLVGPPIEPLDGQTREIAALRDRIEHLSAELQRVSERVNRGRRSEKAKLAAV